MVPEIHAVARKARPPAAGDSVTSLRRLRRCYPQPTLALSAAAATKRANIISRGGAAGITVISRRGGPRVSKPLAQSGLTGAARLVAALTQSAPKRHHPAKSIVTR